MRLFNIYKTIYELSPSKSRYILILLSFLFISVLDLISITTIVVLLSKIFNSDLEGSFFEYLGLLNNTNLIIAVLLIILFKQIVYILIYVFFLNYSYSMKNLFIIKFIKINFLLKQLYSKKENQLNFVRVIEQFSNNSLITSFMLAFEIMVIITVCGYLVYWDSKTTLIIFSIFIILGTVYYSFVPKIIRKLGEKNIYLNNIILKIISYVNDGLREILSFKKTENILNPLRETLTKLKNQLIVYDILNALPRLSFELIIIFALGIIFLMNNNLPGNFLLNSSVFAFAFVKLIPSILKLMNLINSLNYGDFALNEIKKIHNIYLENIVVKKNVSNLIKSRNTDFDYIKIHNLAVKFENNKTITYPNFNIKKNQKILILSKSGKGKSTLLDIICNFRDKEKGSVDYFKDDKKINFDNDQIAYSPQLNLILDGSFNQNIEIKIDQTYKKYLSPLIFKFFESNKNILNENTLSQSSGGEKKRIGILRTILNAENDKSILIFDEPTASLDEKNKEIFYEWLNNIKNKTIVVASHDENKESYYDNVLRL